jgi:hypothetical protein
VFLLAVFCVHILTILWAVGDPHLDFKKGMEAEHCRSKGSRDKFVTPNYNISTTPANEWAITVDFDLTNADMRHGRSLVKIQDNMQKEIVKLSMLTEVEVIAVVLYTGPMVSSRT